MTKRLCSALRVILVLIAVSTWPGLALAAEQPDLPPGEYIYTINHSVRGGIGTLFIELTPKGDAVEAKISRHIQVKVLGVTVYRETTRVVQTLQNGKLLSLNRVSEVNGKKSELMIELEDGALVAEMEGQEWQLDAGLLPTSPWNKAVIERKQLIDTKTGKEISVTNEAKGTSEVEAARKRLDADHFTQHGGINRDLWYDDKGVFVQSQLHLDDAVITMTLVRGP